MNNNPSKLSWQKKSSFQFRIPFGLKHKLLQGEMDNLLDLSFFNDVNWWHHYMLTDVISTTYFTTRIKSEFLSFSWQICAVNMFKKIKDCWYLNYKTQYCWKFSFILFLFKLEEVWTISLYNLLKSCGKMEAAATCDGQTDINISKYL